ncbi:hypothetical protein AB0L02_10510 [Streptomyces anulatus]
MPRGAPRVRCNICNTHCVYRSTLSNIRADARSMVTTGPPHADQRGALQCPDPQQGRPTPPRPPMSSVSVSPW